MNKMPHSIRQSLAHRLAYFLVPSEVMFPAFVTGIAFLSLCASVAFGQNSKFEKERKWSEKSGKFTTNATLVSGNRQSITLRKSLDGSIVTVPVDRLSDGDKEFVGQYCKSVFKDLKKEVGQALYASDSLKLYENFQTNGFIDSSNQIYVESKIEALRKAAAKNAIILEDRFLPAAELPDFKKTTQKLVEEWVALGSGEDLTKIYEANKNDPTSIEAAILLSLWFEVHDADYKAAQRRLDEAVERASRYLPIASKADKRNLGVAINNLAVSYVRDNKLPKAVRVWADIPASLSPTLSSAFKHNLSKAIRMVGSNRSGLKKADHAVLRKIEGLSLKPTGSVSGGWQLLCPVDQKENVIGNLQFLLADGSAQRISGSIIEDTRCVVCKGTAANRCRNKLCVKGGIEKRIMVPVIANSPGGGTRVVGYRLDHVEYLKCRNCGGDGLVVCPFCKGGIQN